MLSLAKQSFCLKNHLKDTDLQIQKMIAMMYRVYAAVIKEVEDLGYKFLLPN